MGGRGEANELRPADPPALNELGAGSSFKDNINVTWSETCFAANGNQSRDAHRPRGGVLGERGEGADHRGGKLLGDVRHRERGTLHVEVNRHPRLHTLAGRLCLPLLLFCSDGQNVDGSNALVN